MLRRFRHSFVVFADMRIGMVIVLLLAAAGCGGDEAPAGGGGDGGGEPALAGPLTYTRGGGIAGRMDKLVVRPDGSATLTTRAGERTVQLTPEQLDRIAGELDRANLAELPAQSVSEPPRPDAFAHRIVYEGTTVTADDPSMPEQLSGLVATLGALVDEYAQR